MRISLSIEPIFNVFVPPFDAVVDRLTKLCLSCLDLKTHWKNWKNPKKALRKTVRNHFTPTVVPYDIKVTFYNAATAYAIWRAVTYIFKDSSPQFTAVSICSMLFVRRVIQQSLKPSSSVLPSVTTTIQKYHQARGRKWQENMIQIFGCTVFKNWHVTIPYFLKKRWEKYKLFIARSK